MDLDEKVRLWKDFNQMRAIYPKECPINYVDPEHNLVTSIMIQHPVEIVHTKELRADLNSRSLGIRKSFRSRITLPHITVDRFYGHRCMSILPAGVLVCYGETLELAYIAWDVARRILTDDQGQLLWRE